MQFAIEVIFLCKKICLMTLLKSWIKQQLHIQLFCMPSIIVRKRQAVLLCLPNNLNNKPYSFLKHNAHLKLSELVHTKSVLILLLAGFFFFFFSYRVSRDSRKELQPWGSRWAPKVTDGDPAAGCHVLIGHRGIALQDTVPGFWKGASAERRFVNELPAFCLSRAYKVP